MNITVARGIGVWAFCTALSLPAAAAAAPAAPAGGLQLLSGFSGEGRLGFFGNRQDEVQRERYVTEGSMTLDFNLLAFGEERWAFRSRFLLLADLGTSVAQNLPFSPKETTYGFSPFIEHQQGSWLAQFGWDHACQHLIYKDNEKPWYTVEGSNIPPDVYYNRLYIGAGRREIRPEIRRTTYFESAAPRPRWIWYVEAGGYLRSLPGMNGDSLYGGNDWTGDLAGDLRLLLLAGERWLLFANSHTQFLLDAADEIYSRELLQLEAVFDSRGFGSAVYAGWHAVDEHPRDSKEEMLEVGGVFYF